MLCRGELEHRIEEKRTSGKRPVGSEKAHALMATTQASQMHHVQVHTTEIKV